MEIQKFVEQFADAIEVEVSQVSSDLIFKDHPQWDSMAVLSIIAMVDKNYSKIITGEDIENCKTVKELFEIISKK